MVHPLVEKAVPSNAVFTDTTYSILDGELSEKKNSIYMTQKPKEV